MAAPTEEEARALLEARPLRQVRTLLDETIARSRAPADEG